MPLDSGTSTREQLEKAAGDDLPGFIRSRVGLDRHAVQDASAGFIAEATLNDRELRLAGPRTFSSLWRWATSARSSAGSGAPHS